MIVDAHMHIFRAPDWNPSGSKAAWESWARQVRWYDMPLADAEKRYQHTVENSWDPDGSKTIARMDEAKVDDYDGLVLPGGQNNPDLLRVQP